MKLGNNHVSFYVNVGQTLGILGGLWLGYKTIRLEETKAGIQHRPIQQVVEDDIRRLQTWWSDNFGSTQQYRHY